MTPDTVTYRDPSMTFGSRHTPFGTFTVTSGLVAFPDTPPARAYAAEAGLVLLDAAESPTEDDEA